MLTDHMWGQKCFALNGRTGLVVGCFGLSPMGVEDSGLHQPGPFLSGCAGEEG